MSVVYTDNNATTAIAPEVVEAMQPYLSGNYFNPSSMYEAAKSSAEAIQKARETVAHCLGHVEPDQILFTGSATESNNAALFGAIQANPKRTHIITTAVEHQSVLEVCQELERRGHEITFLPVKRNGAFDIDAYVKALRPDTLMVSLMMANNETGVIFPVEQVAEIAKATDPGILVHTDATQAIGKIDVNLSENLRNVDLLAFSGHKLHAPKGIGVLFVRRSTRWRPFIFGGHQERGRRAGTENVPYIVGLAKACQMAFDTVEDEQTRVRALRDRLEEALMERIPMLEVNGKDAGRLPNTLNLAVHGIEGESILYELSANDICASSGSACTSGSLDPSHVLKAMAVPFTAIHGSVRFSLSRYNTDADVDHIIKVFPEIVANLRRLSPFWDNEKSCLINV